MRRNSLVLENHIEIMALGLMCSAEVKNLEEAIENVFYIRVQRGDLSEAMEYLTACINKIPHYTVIRTIIFDILMNNCNQDVTMQAAMYLNELLTIYPPSDSDKRLYYKNALTSGDRSFSTIWDVFYHNITSSFIHYKISDCGEEDYSSQVQYPNCEIVIDFYTKVIAESYDFLSTEEAFYKKTEKSLLAELFWPLESSELSAAKEKPLQFLRFINDIYKNSARIQKNEVSDALHKILKLMIQCIITLKCSSVDETDFTKSIPNSLICNSACLLEIVRVVVKVCAYAIRPRENLRKFINHITVKPFQMKIVENVLYELIYSCKPSERNVAPCTLSTIVNTYMFPKPRKGRKPKKDKMTHDRKKNEYKGQSVLRENALESCLSCEGDTPLHEACRNNKPADLYEMLISASPPDVNAKNRNKQTPLHIACFSGSYYCTKILIDECHGETGQKLDWTATDIQGLTALHISIHKNFYSISKMILKKGGSDLLNAVDNFGRRPFQYASTKEMDNILKEYHLPDIESENCNILSIFSLDIPTLETFKEYALLCHGMHFLLTYYSDIFNLYHIIRLIEDGKGLLIPCHKERACPHFKQCPENAVCDIDLLYLKQLIAIVDHFIKSATTCTKERDLTLDLELLPLQFYIACLQSHSSLSLE